MGSSFSKKGSSVVGGEGGRALERDGVGPEEMNRREETRRRRRGSIFDDDGGWWGRKEEMRELAPSWTGFV